LNFLINGDYGVVFGERGLRPRVLVDTEGNSIGEGQGLLGAERGAAHSNTQEERNESRDSFLDCRESTGGKGTKGETRETEETKEVTWDSQTSPQVYYKYGPSEGKSGSSVRPPRGVQ